MDFSFTEDQLLFRDAIQELLQKECPPEKVRQAWEQGTGKAEGVWENLAEMGVIGLTAPEDIGGMGMDDLDLVLLQEEAGRVCLPDAFMEHTAAALPLLNDYGTEEIKQQWLEKAASGEARLSFGHYQEPHILGAQTSHYILYIDEKALYGFEPSKVELQGQSSVDHSRDLSIIPGSLPDEFIMYQGDDLDNLKDVSFNRCAISTSAQLLGLSKTMLNLAVEYAKVRVQFGKPIGTFQAVKHHLANALVKLEFARPTVYRAAYTLAKDDPEASLHVSLAKALTSDAAIAAAKASLQVHGAIGYTTEHNLHFYMKRTWALASAWGTAPWHRERISSFIL